MAIVRTISMMVGKGSTRHNNRDFNAKNVDPERSNLNVEYCNENIKTVYRELFDQAVERYNAKQKRADRRIANYYEKIRTGKQEKLFHEIIIQIGNKDDMNAKTENGLLAKKILDDYFKTFQKRNPNLRVFSAHLHMDEATPHLHIDFVPFTTGSKRGLDTRVSLKQALANQGFVGGFRSETEWNQWVQSEKEYLSDVMLLHRVIWNEKGTHREHLDVLDFKAQERQKEIADAEKVLAEKKEQIEISERVIENLAQCESELIEIDEDFINDPELQLPEPPPMMSAKKYKSSFVDPLIDKLKSIIKNLIQRIFKQQKDYEKRLTKTKTLERQYSDLRSQYNNLYNAYQDIQPYADESKLLRRYYGDVTITTMMHDAINKRRTKIRETQNRYLNNER